MDEEYIKLFSFIEKLLDRQQKQKFRGLNNYNIVNVVRKATHEVGMHSNVIYSLINPNGDHFQDDLFLNIFVEKVLIPKLGLRKLEDFGTINSVHAEESTDEKRRIDFTIKSDKYLIGIEMKVNAKDLKNQLSDYYDYLQNESTGEDVYIFYLTKYGTNASSGSIANIKNKNIVKKISFEKDILNWLNASQDEVKNIMNLNVALENYKNIVKKITNQYEGNIVSIREELLKSENKEKLDLALKLDKDMNYIKGKVLYNFFTQLSLKFEEEGYDFTVDNYIENDYSTRTINEKKCMEFIGKSKNKPRFFGKAYELKNGKYLFVYVAIKSLCYGVLDRNNLNDEFNEPNISNKKFLSFISSAKCEYNVVDNIEKMISIEQFYEKLDEYIKTVTK